MNALDSIRPSDQELLGILAEMLSDISAGRLVTREPIYQPVVELMYRNCPRTFRSAAEVDCAVEATVDRLLTIADDWHGIPALMEPCAAVILGEPMPTLPNYAFAYRRAPDPAVCRLQ
jgi:hypothetical protein